MVDITNLIIQKIAMEGERAVIAKLEAIKKAGTEAFSGVGSKQAQRSLAELQSGLTGVERRAVAFGFALRDVSDNAGASFKRMAVGAGLVIGALTAAGLAASKFVDSSVGVVDELRSSAIAAGQTIDSFARLQFAFTQSGGKAEAFQRGLSVVNDAIGDIQSGKATDVTKTFARIGVSLVDAAGKGREAEDIFKDVADVMKGITNPADQAALAIQLFGRRIGPQMVELLQEGRKGIEDLGRDFTKLTGGVTKEQGRMADAMKDAMNRVAVASRGTNVQLGLLFAPSITDASNRFADSIANSRARVVAFGETVRDFLVPLIEDFTSLLVGEPEKIKSSFVFTIAKAIDGIIFAIRAMIFVFQGWIAILDVVGKLLNSVFGTEFTGASLAAILIVTRLVGGFRLLASVIALVRTGMLLLGATTLAVGAPFALAVAAALALGVALGLLAVWLSGGKLDFGTLAASATAAWETIKAGATASAISYPLPRQAFRLPFRSTRKG